MLKVKRNHKNDVNDIKCQLCSKHDGTAKHVMVCERENSGKQYKKHWGVMWRFQGV